MNINEKQKLWSKYYLIHSGRKNSLVSLIRFVDKEAEQFHLDKKNSTQKKIKIFKFMLKSLTRDEIVKTYFPRAEKDVSKNSIIEKLSAYIQ